MGEKLTKELLSQLYDETGKKAKKIGELLGMPQKGIEYLHSQLLFDGLRKIPPEEFDKLVKKQNVD